MDLSFLVNDDAGLRRILADARTIAVVGLSADISRPSHGVAAYLQRVGYSIIPVHPTDKEVLGVPAVRSLHEIQVPIDVVDVFRRSSQVAPHVDEAIAVKARVVWLQDGVIDEVAAHKAHAAGLEVVMDRCMLRDHRRLGR